MQKTTDSKDIINIIHEFQNGNKEVFSLIIKKYRKYIFSLLIKKIESKEDAEDLTQEIFIKLYNSLDNFKFKSSLKTYIYRMVTNKISDFKKQKNKTRQEYQLIEEFNENIYENDIDDKIIEEENIKNLEEAIKQLPEKYKTLIYMRDFKNMNYKKIAKELQITENTAKIRHFYALKKLKQIIESIS